MACYNLHHDDLQEDVLRPPHSSTVKINKLRVPAYPSALSRKAQDTNKMWISKTEKIMWAGSGQGPYPYSGALLVFLMHGLYPAGGSRKSLKRGLGLNILPYILPYIWWVKSKMQSIGDVLNFTIWHLSFSWRHYWHRWDHATENVFDFLFQIIQRFDFKLFKLKIYWTKSFRNHLPLTRKKRRYEKRGYS